MIPSPEAVAAALRRFGVPVPPRATLAAALAPPEGGAPPPVAVDSGDVEHAIRDVVDMARRLAALPPPTRKDDQGYAAVTDVPMRNYLALVDRDPRRVALVDHYRAATMLGIHKNTQLGKERVENAIATLGAALTAQGTPLPTAGPGRYRIFSPTEGRHLRDGSSYSWNDAKGEARFTLPKRQDGTRVFDVLRRAGIPRLTWDTTPGMAVRNDLIVPRQHVRAVAAALAPHYPELAAAVDSLGGVWSLPTESAGASPGNTDAGPAARGNGVRWEPVAAGSTARFTFDPIVRHGITRAFLEENKLNTIARWVKGPEGSWSLDVLLAPLTDAHRTALGKRVPVLATALREMQNAYRQEAEAAAETIKGESGAETRRVLRLTGWMMEEATRERFERDGAPPEVIRALADTRPGDERGEMGAVIWEIEPDGQTLAIHNLGRTANKVVTDRIKSAKVFPGAPGNPWVLRMRLAYVPALARVLDELGLFGLAAQLRAALLVDNTTPTCAELEELAAAFTPEEVDNPRARGWITEVDTLLRTRLAEGMRLFPYQSIGVAYLRATGYRALLADEMGLGKTPQAIATIALEPERLLPAVVVCPSAVMHNWRKEFARFYPRARVKVITHAGDFALAAGSDVIVVSWERLRRQTESVRRFAPKYVIADEGHAAKNEAAGRTQALQQLATLAPHFLIMTGTPAPNRPIELFTLLNMIDPIGFPDSTSFGRRYANAAQRTVAVRNPLSGAIVERTFWDDRGASNIDELRDRLRCVMIRRLKAEVAKDLPPLMLVPRPFELNGEERAEYDRLLREWMREYISERQAEGASAQEIYRAMFAAGLLKAGKLRRHLGKIKARYAVEEVRAFRADPANAGKNLLIFAEHDAVVQDMRAALVTDGLRVATIQGDATPGRKAAIAEAFSQGEYDVLIGTRAISEGVNLQTGASDALVVELWWTPKDFEQAIARLHRTGQKHTVWVRVLHALDTYDDHIEEAILEPKRKVLGKLFGVGTSGSGVVFSADGAREDDEALA